MYVKLTSKLQFINTKLLGFSIVTSQATEYYYVTQGGYSQGTHHVSLIAIAEKCLSLEEYHELKAKDKPVRCAVIMQHTVDNGQNTL